MLYASQAGEYIRGRIGILLEVVDDQVERLNNSTGRWEQRLPQAENTWIAKATSRKASAYRSAKCVAVETEINDFYREAARLQFGVAGLIDPAGGTGI